jgi:hypothetical protein
LIGWAIAPPMRASLVTDALSTPHDRGLTADNTIMHADRQSSNTRRKSSATS